MDEVLFECRFTETEERTVELVGRIMKARRVILMILIAPIALWFVWSAVEEILFGQGFFYTALSVVYVLLFLYLIFQSRITAKIHFRRTMKFYNGTMPEAHYVFTGQEILSHYGDQQIRIPYDKLNRVLISKHLMILFAQKYARVAFPKDSFTKGTYEEFLVFLRTRCPDLKIPE